MICFKIKVLRCIENQVKNFYFLILFNTSLIMRLASFKIIKIIN